MADSNKGAVLTGGRYAGIVEAVRGRFSGAPRGFRMSFKKNIHIAKNYFLGKLRFVEFAVTNACIAQCSFCDIWKQKPKVFVDKDKALEAIDRLAGFGAGHLTFTGGEPLLHPHIVEFVERATKRDINSAVLNAAPRLLMRGDILKRLENAGCDLLSISFDSGDAVTMAQSRRIPNLMDDMAKALELIQKTRLKTMASVLIWNDNYNKLEEVCVRAKKMGFDFVSLNYPTFSRSNVYPLGGDGVSLSREHVIAGLEDAIRLKKTGKYGIINQSISMRNIIGYLRDPERVRYRCYGGDKVLFLDWFFDMRPCMQLPDVLGNIFTMTEAGFKKTLCNDCNMSWYRDFSAWFFGLRSIPVLLDSLSGSKNILKSAARRTA